MQAEFFIFFSVFKVLLLNISKTYSDSDCWETNLRVSPFKGDQHHAYHPRTACNLLWVCLFLGVLGTFYRNRKGLTKEKSIISAERRREQVQLSPWMESSHVMWRSELPTTQAASPGKWRQVRRRGARQHDAFEILNSIRTMRFHASVE